MSKTSSYRVRFKALRRFSSATCEEGGALVEIGLACAILIPILFGIIQLSIGLYCFHFAADAAREATRWAMVRGETCSANFGAAYCSPTSNQASADGNDIDQYVKSLGYPFSGAVTTSTKWCPTTGSTPATWGTCSATGSKKVGNQVQVTVSYSYPLVIPFVPRRSLSVSSVSTMTIVQ
jgi:Flp pilus assembly protein TadG